MMVMTLQRGAGESACEETGGQNACMVHQFYKRHMPCYSGQEARRLHRGHGSLCALTAPTDWGLVQLLGASG